jgi:hypothetical protein
MTFYKDITYYKVKINSRKHMIIGKMTKENNYHFHIVKLTDHSAIEGWETVRSRNKLHILSKEFAMSKETIDCLHYFTNKK